MSAYPVISLSSRDGVVIARATLEPGTPIAEGLTTSERIPPGHKVAIRPHMAGEAQLPTPLLVRKAHLYQLHSRTSEF